MKRQLPSQTLEEQFFRSDTRQAPLSETIRLGAQFMLQKAVELEVSEFLGRSHYQRSADCLLRGYRNGYEDKQEQTAEGPLHLKTYQEQFPEAMKCLATELAECLTALRFPEPHQKRIRTTNLLERLFGEGQRRSKVIPRFMNERSGLSLMFAVLVDASAGWRGVKITPSISRELDALMTDSKAKPGVGLAA